MKPEKTYEEYQLMAGLLNRFYFGSLHLFLGTEWPHSAMNPDTMEMMEGETISDHKNKYSDAWVPSRVTQENNGWHRWVDLNRKR